MMLLGAALSAVGLGCTASRATQVAPEESSRAKHLPELRLPPSSLGQQVSVNQRLSFSHQDDPGAPRTLEALLEIDATHLRLAGFAMHHRVFTMGWDGHELTEQRAPQVPAQLVAGDVLRDIQLAYWPADAITAALPTGWRLEEGPRLRVLSEGDAERVRIQYDSASGWSGRTTLENHTGRYRLVIDSTASEE